MTDLRAAAKQALETLEDPWAAGPEGVADAITALRATLTEPVQEPVTRLFGTLPVYDTPPQRPAESKQDVKGCDHCNSPLYAAVKCRVCGRVTEPVDKQSYELGLFHGAAAEREACAKVCEEFYSIEFVAQECAAAIRSRSK